MTPARTTASAFTGIFPSRRRVGRTGPKRPVDPTVNEMQALTLLAEGLSPAEIAHERGTCISSAEKLIASARRRVGGRTLAHGIAIAIRKGFI